jgi:hypothetical protein
MKKTFDVALFAEKYFDYEEKETENPAWEYFWEIGQNDPDEAWDLILAIAKVAKNQSNLSYLAAGPLESLINDHGDRFIEFIEQEAKKNTTLAWMLREVWPNENNKPVYDRVMKMQELYKDQTIDLPEE